MQDYNSANHLFMRSIINEHFTYFPGANGVNQKLLKINTAKDFRRLSQRGLSEDDLSQPYP